MIFGPQGELILSDGEERSAVENRQVRSSFDAELRVGASDDAMVIEGRAISYNKVSSTYIAPGCREKIAPGCFRGSIGKSDVVALVNHDSSQILGRTSNGTLKLDDSGDALRFSIRLNPNVQAHRDIHSLVKDGTLHGCSFAFFSDEDDWENGIDEDGKRCRIRTVKRGRLQDVSVVTVPAYGNGATDAQARSAENVSDDDTSALREQFEAVKIF